MTAPPLTRRRFGQAMGAGALTITFSWAPPLAAAESGSLPGSLAKHPMLDAWLRINPDGTVTLLTGKVELGQGILTALQQIAADELDLAPGRIAVIAGDTAQTPDEGFTAGSQSIEYGGAAIRYACAEARDILMKLAATQLRLPPETLSVEDGSIKAPDGRSLSYWRLSSQAQLHREASTAVPPKTPERHQYIGKSAARIDIPAKVTGGASYVQDIRLPGMLFGRVSRPPSYHAELVSFDEATIRRLPGIVALVRDGRFLGVIAEREEQAIAARREIARATQWRDQPVLPASSGIYEYLKALPTQDQLVTSAGEDVPPPAALSAHRATYTRTYMAHASIGPSCAVAQLKDGQLTVWTHTQGVFPLRRDLAKALDMDVRAIRCIHVQGSGCYGHNGADDVALDAALLARASAAGPSKCSGCATTSLAGSRTDRP